MLEEGGGRMNTSKWGKEGEERFCVGEPLIDTGSLTHTKAGSEDCFGSLEKWFPKWLATFWWASIIHLRIKLILSHLLRVIKNSSNLQNLAHLLESTDRIQKSECDKNLICRSLTVQAHKTGGWNYCLWQSILLLVYQLCSLKLSMVFVVITLSLTNIWDNQLIEEKILLGSQFRCFCPQFLGTLVAPHRGSV